MSNNSAALAKGEKSLVSTYWRFSLPRCSGQCHMELGSGKMCAVGIALKWKMLWKVSKAPSQEERCDWKHIQCGGDIVVCLVGLSQLSSSREVYGLVNIL